MLPLLQYLAAKNKEEEEPDIKDVELKQRMKKRMWLLLLVDSWYAAFFLV